MLGVAIIGIGAWVAFAQLVGWWPAVALLVFLWANNAIIDLGQRERRIRERAFAQQITELARAATRRRVKEFVQDTEGEKL